MKKKLLALALCLCMGLTLAACSAEGKPAESAGSQADQTSTAEDSAAADSDLAYIKKNGKLVIGYTVYEPMNYTDKSGKFTGFDTELARLVCEKLGVEPEFVKINWDTKEVELAGKSIDCIWNGMTIDEDRKANMEVTKPYVKNAQVVVTKADFAYTDTTSLEGKTVCAEIGSAGETTVTADAGLAKADYVGKSIQTDCLMEVKAGTADAAVLDLTLANAMIGEGTNYGDLTIQDKLAVENYGVGFRKGSDLCTEVNSIFDQLNSDGSMSKLAEEYGLDLAE